MILPIGCTDLLIGGSAMKNRIIPLLQDYSSSLLGFIRYLRDHVPCVPGADQGTSLENEEEEFRR